MSTTRKITLKSSDGEAFEVDEAVALESQTIKHVIEDDCADSGIPLPNVTSKMLAEVIEYCKKHVKPSNPEERTPEEDLKAWDADFVKGDLAKLVNLRSAADFLEIKSLHDLTTQAIADMMKGKIILKSSDGEAFIVDEAVALQSQMIKDMIGDDCADSGKHVIKDDCPDSGKHVIKDDCPDSGKHVIKDDCPDSGIPLPNVTSKILAKVIEYCKKHVEASNLEERTPEEDLKAWDADFVKVDQATLFDLILAANYLNIKSLLDLTCQTVADMIRGKTPEEICEILNIGIDMTPEEEEEVRRENQWAFE